MVRRTIGVVRAAEDGAAVTPRKTRREAIRLREALDQLCDARCPLCRSRLVARQGRAGPYFFCACTRQRAA